METKFVETLEVEKREDFITLKKFIPYNNLGDVIVKIASSYYFVNKDDLIDEIASDLEKDQLITTIGVIDEKGYPIGIITRRGLFDILGRNYGREVFKNRTAERVYKKVNSFDSERNIFSIAEEIGDSLYGNSVEYYLLVADHTRFAGVISTIDLLKHLSIMMTHDIKLAVKIQQNIVKQYDEYKSDGIDIIGYSKMAKGVGGDFYSIMNYGNRWICAVCDVTGKGVSASLVSAIVGGMFSAYDMRMGLKSFILKLNNYISATFKLEKYMTGFFLEYNETNNIAVIYDMGHTMFNIYRNNKCYNVKLNKNLPVGIKPDIPVTRTVFKLHPGDRCVIYTDGIIDQRNSYGEFFGYNRFVRSIGKNLRKSLKYSTDELLKEIDLFRGNYPRFDDITMIAFDCK